MSPNNIKLCVIICTMNRHEDLDLTLHSIFNSYTNHSKIIIVDDSNNNLTEKVMDKWKSLFTDVKIVSVHPKYTSKSLTKARNTGINNIDDEDVLIFNTIEHDRMPEIMNCANVFALTSMYEGMPTVVLEALACGIPVVSTDVGDVHKVVKNGESGYIVKGRSIIEFKNVLSNVLIVDNNFENKCIAIVQDYSYDVVGDEIKNIYLTI